MRNLNKVISMLHDEEGFEAKPYKDSEEVLSIGYGTNIQNGITKEEADLLLINRLVSIEDFLDKYDWYQRLNEPRKDVLCDMGYNLGIERLMGFKKLIMALFVNDYDRAAKEMLCSKWAGQVGVRAIKLAKIMKSGEYYSKDA